MSNKNGEGDPGKSSQLAGALIGLLGILSIVAHLQLLPSTAGFPVTILTIGFPVVLGLALVAAGYLTARRNLVGPEDAIRLAVWVIAGMSVFLLIGVWILILNILLSQSVPFDFLLTVNAVTLGGVVGVVLGLYDAQSRTYTRKLEHRERELQAQNERLDEFVSIVSHDLRNPLNVAQGRLELAREEHTGEHLESVARSLQRMEVLIENLLQLARETDSVSDFQSVHLGDVVETCWQNVETANADLQTNTAAVIKADGSRLQQLLENLLRNAVEHGGDEVTVKVGELTEPAGFYVADNGPGIPEDKRDQVFESGYTSQTNGTGFGLAIVSQVVEAHDWKIEIKTSSDGGARFEITNVEFANNDGFEAN